MNFLNADFSKITTKIAYLASEHIHVMKLLLFAITRS